MSNGNVLDEIINVACLVFPNAEVYFTDDPTTVDQAIKNWKSMQPQAKYDGCMGGVVALKMLRSDYKRVPATIQSYDVFRPGRPDGQAV